MVPLTSVCANANEQTHMSMVLSSSFFKFSIRNVFNKLFMLMLIIFTFLGFLPQNYLKM